MGSEGGSGSGRDQGPGARPDGERSDKVIRLPRDWLGPRDELIPFGPSSEDADPSSGASGGPPAGGPTPPDDKAVSAEDFWGERSAAVQGPLDEPDPDLGESRPEDAAGMGFAARRRLRVPTLAAAAAVVVALAVAAGVVASLQAGPASHRTGPRAQVGGAPDRGIPAILPARTPRVAGRGAHSRRQAARRNVSRRKTRASGVVPVNYVHSGTTPSTPTAPNPGGTPGGSAPPPSSPAPPSSPHDNGPPPLPSNSTPGNAHRGCTFGPNCALGPGHSPDG
jgi:hypothetical protein